MNPNRLGGHVHKVHPGTGEKSGFGIIIGDDARHYFFLPSYLRDPLIFRRLTPESKVTFRPLAHDRGMRALNITVTHLIPMPEPATVVSHGENTAV